MGLFKSLIGSMLSSAFDPSTCDWYCDECDALLNAQAGFYPTCGTWTCTECGYENEIDESEVITESEYQRHMDEKYARSPYDDDDYDDEEDEKLSIFEAALIWASNGKDEDYTFGYSEEDLEDAL